ncbi:YjbF family lipoprotein [Enterovibrio makurazakiensis]|uniref:YjbF family lipoprotein n=1 Tax=Enterovibrio makurazakiensis TaxID=2910232 RepID=UPI003D1F2F50
MKELKTILQVAMSVVVITTLSGCSQKFQDVKDTMSLAVFGHEDIELNANQINDLPYASLYAKVEGSGQAFLVLGYANASFSNLPDGIDNYQLKWLSANKEMLVTEHGRITKTVNLLSGNLEASYSHQADPVALGLLKNSTPRVWKRKVDWSPGYHTGYLLESRFELQGENTLMINEKPVETLHFIEYVSAPDLDIQFTNHFWLQPLSGHVVASTQTPAPGLPKIDITLLKPFAVGAQ